VGESSETHGSLDTPHTRRSSLVVLIVSDSPSAPTTIGFIELLDSTTGLQDGRVTSSSKTELQDVNTGLIQAGRVTSSSKKELRNVNTGLQDVRATSSSKTELTDVDTGLYTLKGVTSYSKKELREVNTGRVTSSRAARY